MKTIRSLILLFIVSVSLVGGTAAKSPRSTKMAPVHYWTWAYDSNTRDWDAYFRELTNVGVRGLILMASPESMERVIPIATKYGIEVHAWMWIMNNGGIAAKHPEWLDYNREGKSLSEKRAYVDYYKFLSPIIPGVREEIAKGVEDMARVKGLGGISMDYCRYVDQILPTSLWAGYGIIQDKEYAEWDYGYHPDMLAAFEQKYGYDPSKLEDPSTDKKWLQFRLDQVTEVTDILYKIAHKNGTKLCASPFPTPSMSRRMVRQDWGRWKLDVAFPMIYHGFYYGGAAWIADCVRECVKAKPRTDIFCGLHVPDFGNPKGPTLTEAMTAALDAGAKGIAFYTFDSLSPEKRAELKKFIQQHP